MTDFPKKENQSDSDSDFDYEEYRTKQERNLRLAVLAEEQFKEVKRKWWNRRCFEIKSARNRLKEGKSIEYLEKKDAILDEAHREKMKNRALYELEREALLNKIDAEKEYVKNEQNDNRQLMKEQLIYAIEEVIKEKLLITSYKLAAIDTQIPRRKNLNPAPKITVNDETLQIWK